MPLEISHRIGRPTYEIRCNDCEESFVHLVLVRWYRYVSVVDNDIIYLVFFPLSVTDHSSIVSLAAVVLQCESDPNAGDQDHDHRNNEPQHEQEDGVVQIIRALPVRSATHAGGLGRETSPA